MADLVDIKDRSPNQGTIDTLKRLLEEAESGELRSLFYVISYDDQTTANGWSLDNRCHKVTMLGEFELAKSDFAINILNKYDSVFRSIVEGE